MTARTLAGALVFVGAVTLGMAAPPNPVVIRNANAEQLMTAFGRAVAIAGDRFLAVGSNRDILALATGRSRKVDLGGKTVVPGFIDAHTHVSYSGLRHLRQLDCDLRSIAAIQDAIRKRAVSTPRGQWVVGFKYDDTKTSEGRKLTHADLDGSIHRRVLRQPRQCDEPAVRDARHRRDDGLRARDDYNSAAAARPVHVRGPQLQ